MNYTKQEKELFLGLLCGLMNDKEMNQWQHDFIKSIVEKEQLSFTDKQKIKLREALEKAGEYEYRNILHILINNT